MRELLGMIEKMVYLNGVLEIDFSYYFEYF